MLANVLYLFAMDVDKFISTWNVVWTQNTEKHIEQRAVLRLYWHKNTMAAYVKYVKHFFTFCHSKFLISLYKLITSRILGSKNTSSLKRQQNRAPVVVSFRGTTEEYHIRSLIEYYYVTSTKSP